MVRDEVLKTVHDYPDADMVAKTDGHNQTYTFFFGLKWKYFQDFNRTVSLDTLETTNVERLIFDYAIENDLNII